MAGTDWDQIVLLLHLAPQPLTLLHRSIGLRYTAELQAAFVEVHALCDMPGHELPEVDPADRYSEPAELTT